MRSQPTQSAPGRQPITTQLPVAQPPDDEPEWEDAGEDSMDSQDAEYDDDGSSKESMEEDAEDAEDDPLGDYGVQRPIETEYYEFVESQPSVISLSDTPTGRSDIRIGLPGRTTPPLRVSRSRFMMLTNSSGDPSSAGSSIIPTPAGLIPVTTQHEQPAIRSR